MGNQNSNDAAGLRSHDTSTVQEEIDALRALLAKNQGGAAESASQSQAQTPPQAQLQPQAQSQSNYSKPHNKFPAPPVAASIPSAYSKESLTKDSAGVESVTPPATGLDNHDLSKVKNHGGTAESASQSQAQTPPQTPPQAQLQPQAQSQSNYSKPHNKFPAPPAAASIPSAYSKESSNNNPPANREEENTSNWSKVVEWAGWGVRKGCKGVCWLIEKCFSGLWTVTTVGVPAVWNFFTDCMSGAKNVIDLGIKACGVGVTAFSVLPEKTKGTIIGFLGGVGAWYKIKNKLKKLETINLNDAKELIKNGKSEDNEKLAKYLKYTQQITLNKEPEVDTPIETKRSTLGLIVSTTKSTFSAIKNTFSFINNTFFAKKTLQEKGKNEESEIVKEDLHMILLQGAINCHNIEAVKLLLKCNDTIMKKTKAVVSTGKSKGVNLFVSKEIKTQFEGVDVKDKQDLLSQAIKKLEEVRIPENSYDLSSYINTTATIELLEIGEVEITVTKQQDQSKKKENIQAKCVVNKGKNDEYRIILYFPIEDSGESQVDNGSSESVDILNSPIEDSGESHVDNGSSESVDILNSEQFKKLLATQLKNYRDSLDIIDVLLQKGVNPDQMPIIDGFIYNIPLAEAMQKVNQELFVVLLKNGAKADQEIVNYAWDLIDSAIQNEQKKIATEKTQEIIEQENIDKRPFYKLLAQPNCSNGQQLWKTVTILPHKEEGNLQNDGDTSAKSEKVQEGFAVAFQQIEVLNIAQNAAFQDQKNLEAQKREIYEDPNGSRLDLPDNQVNDHTNAKEPLSNERDNQANGSTADVVIVQNHPSDRKSRLQNNALKDSRKDDCLPSSSNSSRLDRSRDDWSLISSNSSPLDRSRDELSFISSNSSKIKNTNEIHSHCTSVGVLFAPPQSVESQNFREVKYPHSLKSPVNPQQKVTNGQSEGNDLPARPETPSASNTQVAVQNTPVKTVVNEPTSSVCPRSVSGRDLDNEIKQMVFHYSLLSLPQREIWKQQYVQSMINNFFQDNNIRGQFISDEMLKNIVNFISDRQKLLDLMNKLVELQKSSGEINALPSPLLVIMFGEEKLPLIAKPKDDITKYDYLSLLNALKGWIAVIDPLTYQGAMSTIVHTLSPGDIPVTTFIDSAAARAQEIGRLKYEKGLSTKWEDGTANIKDIYDFGCLIYRKGLNQEQLKALLGGSTIPQICWNAPKTVLKHMCDGTALGMNVVINKENYVIFAQGGKRLFGFGAKLLLNHVQHKYMLGYTPSQVQQLLLRYNPVKMLENGEKSTEDTFSSRVVDGVAMALFPNKPPVDNPEDKTQGEDGDEKASDEKTSPEKGQDSAIPPKVSTPVRLNVPFIPGVWGVGGQFGLGTFGVKGPVGNMGANSAGVNSDTVGPQDDASSSQDKGKFNSAEGQYTPKDQDTSCDGGRNPGNLVDKLDNALLTVSNTLSKRNNVVLKGLGWFLGNSVKTSQKAASLNKESNKKAEKTDDYYHREDIDQQNNTTDDYYHREEIDHQNNTTDDQEIIVYINDLEKNQDLDDAEAEQTTPGDDSNNINEPSTIDIHGFREGAELGGEVNNIF